MAQMRKYYEAQLRFLREQSQEFVARYPKLAPFLGEAAQDPDVERLLEGFAFISGKLWHKIEDAYPEISEQLLEFIAPNYLKPMPSCTMLEFLPKVSQGNVEKIIQRGTLIDVHREQQRYFFSTCYQTQVLPLKITRVHCVREFEYLKLRLDFECVGTANLLCMPKFLRLHFSRDLAFAYWWYYLFLNQMQSASFLADGRTIVLKSLKCQPVGFKGDESLLPFKTEHYQVEQHLLEYYSFPEKFLFVDLLGIPWEVAPYAQTFSLEFSLKAPLSLNFNAELESFKINCCPLMNIWEYSALPMAHRYEQQRYLLQVPDYDAAVHSVVAVSAWSDVVRTQYHYEAFYERSYALQDQRLYQVHLSEGVATEVPQVYLELRDEACEVQALVIAPRVLAYQPQVHTILQRGDIVDGSQNLLGCAYKNVSGLSIPVYPPLHRELSWRLLCAVALQYKNLHDLESLRALLMHHDFAAQHGHRYQGVGQRVAMSLEALKHEKHLRFYRGEALRGLVSQILVREEAFLNKGELYLFGSILAKILQDRAPFNSFHDLEFSILASGEVLRWVSDFA